MNKQTLEKTIFRAFLDAQPLFAGESMGDWDRPPIDPPDIVGVTATGMRVGVELAAWLNEDQIRARKRAEAIENSILEAIGKQPTNDCEHISHIRFLPSNRRNRVAPNDKESFREQLFDFIHQTDRHWDESYNRPLGYSTGDLSSSPAVEKYVESLQCLPKCYWQGGRLVETDYHPDQPWIRVPIRGGAFDPVDAQEALDEVLRKKTEDPRYYGVRKESGLAQLHLLVHYDTRAAIYNTPAVTPWHSFHDVAQQAGVRLNSAGAFDHVFLFIAATFPFAESSQSSVFRIV